MTERREFLQGMIAGLTGTLVGSIAVVYGLARANLVVLDNTALSNPSEWLTWAYTNLGSSIPIFAMLLIAFFVTLGRLRKCLDDNRPVNQIVQLDHLTDIWTTLFFGTGVIWTAIGMRSALIFALGDRNLALSQGAFAMLERMIDGGILLALSTTIFGGVGGYLMRVYKTVSFGAELQHRYDLAARADTSQMRESLKRIEEHLDGDRRTETHTPTDAS
ncbi:MAG: hypothetical protein KJO82_03440 [Gammaproteobacteria bacterium]|nr:hypothetical protein [Gammaproteobacteria bacterium]NNC76402.1 hypothetical protein [Woeseiaceae bacterium]